MTVATWMMLASYVVSHDQACMIIIIYNYATEGAEYIHTVLDYIYIYSMKGPAVQHIRNERSSYFSDMILLQQLQSGIIYSAPGRR